MELTQLTPTALSELIQLVDKKQTLLDQIAKVEASMESVIVGQTPAKTAVAKAPRSLVAPTPAATPKADAPARAKRGALKEGILAALETAGPEGLSVSELSAKLDVAPANIHVWFSTTGKKLAEIAKLSAGRYALGATAPAVALIAAEETPVAASVEPTPAVAETPTPAWETPAPMELEAAPAASVVEPALTAPTPLVEETPVIDETPIAESTIELEPEASAPTPDENETLAKNKNDELLLSSD